MPKDNRNQGNNTGNMENKEKILDWPPETPGRKFEYQFNEINEKTDFSIPLEEGGKTSYLEALRKKQGKVEETR